MNQQGFRQVSQKSPEATPIEVNRIEGREWWLWGFAVPVIRELRDSLPTSPVCRIAIPERLLRNHPNRPQSRLHQLRPSRYRKLRAPQPKRMSALRIQMHLHGNPSLLQRDVVSQRVVYAVDVVILRLQ